MLRNDFETKEENTNLAEFVEQSISSESIARTHMATQYGFITVYVCAKSLYISKLDNRQFISIRMNDRCHQCRNQFDGRYEKTYSKIRLDAVNRRH